MGKLIKLFVSIFLLLTLVACSKEGNIDVDLNPLPDEKYATIDGYGLHGGMLSMIWDGEQTETGAMDFIVVEGQTVKEALENAGIKELSAFNEYDTFEGWLVFDVEITPGDDGFDIFTYTLTSETVYTTEELMNLTIPATQVTYVAKWAGLETSAYFVEEDYMFDETTTGSFILHTNEGALYYTSSSDNGVYDCESYTYWMEDGLTLNDLSQTGEWDTFNRVENESKTFVGWKVYEGTEVTWSSDNYVTTTQTAFEYMDYEGFEYLVITDCVQLEGYKTTEEIMEIINNSKVYYALAVWE